MLLQVHLLRQGLKVHVRGLHSKDEEGPRIGGHDLITAWSCDHGEFSRDEGGGQAIRWDDDSVAVAVSVVGGSGGAAQRVHVACERSGIVIQVGGGGVC